MELDEELCLCFHVTRRKVLNYLRIERPRRASQLADCQGAGTGCGWCRPFLERLFEQARRDQCRPPVVDESSPLPEADDYAARRAQYLAAGGGRPPPGATPPPPLSPPPPQT